MNASVFANGWHEGQMNIKFTFSNTSERLTYFEVTLAPLVYVSAISASPLSTPSTS